MDCSLGLVEKGNTCFLEMLAAPRCQKMNEVRCSCLTLIIEGCQLFSNSDVTFCDMDQSQRSVFLILNNLTVSIRLSRINLDKS